MQLMCSKCYDRLDHSRPRCRMTRAQRFARVYRALTEHDCIRDKGRYGGPDSIARQITARCLTCGHRSTEGYIVRMER